MGKAAPKLILSPSRDIPFDRLVLSQSNVRTIKCGVSIGELAEDIARRTLLQSLNVRPVRDETGNETGAYEVPAGGRRFRALEQLVKQKRFPKDGPVPCVVRSALGEGDATAEEDSLAENVFREQLHPLDQFRAMHALAEQGSAIEDIAARFMTTPAVVRQRLRLASVSPVLCDLYAQDGMTLDQLMAFSVCEDHARQVQVWDMLSHHWDRSSHLIRRRLTETSVAATDRRVLFIGLDAYLTAGGTVMRDLFEDDRGGWLADVGLLDQLVMEKLGAEGERIGSEGWKWVAVAIDFAYGHDRGMREIDGFDAPITSDERARLEALEAERDAIMAEHGEDPHVPDDVRGRHDAVLHEMQSITVRPIAYDPVETARAGVFVSLDTDGTLYVDRGYVRPEDEPDYVAADQSDEAQDGDEARVIVDADQPGAVVMTANGAPASGTDDDEDGVLKPLPDRLVTEMTAHRTLALSDALAGNPAVAFVVVLHALAASAFYYASRASCVAISATRPSFMHQESGLADSASARSIDARHKHWQARLPKSDLDLWDTLIVMPAEDQALLFAHCAACGVNAVWEPVGRYDNGRISAHSIEQRIAHSHVLARAVGLDMVGAGWRPTVDTFLGRVTKPRILEAVTEARGAETAELIDHLKKGDMAREAERLLDGAGWLPEPLRTPVLEDREITIEPEPTGAGEVTELPAFLVVEGAEVEPPEDGSPAEFAVAAE
ncbi:MAG: ParB/RepB/Spo0J family partition protein [Sphingomonas sp.]